MQKRALPLWLDRETSLLVDEMIDLLVKRHPDILALSSMDRLLDMKNVFCMSLIPVMLIYLS
jgi:hypothetical protein